MTTLICILVLLPTLILILMLVLTRILIIILILILILLLTLILVVHVDSLVPFSIFTVMYSDLLLSSAA